MRPPSMICCIRPAALLPPRPLPFASILSTRPRHFSTSGFRQAAEQDHYAVLGVGRNASRKEIKEKFYELSRTFHPDAPSTSSSDTQETRTARFQSISESYATLSDDKRRRHYDAVSGDHHGRRPRYTHAGPENSPGSRYTGGAGAAWSNGENDARRQRANYAWQHPARRSGPQPVNRADPFAQRKDPNQVRSADDHFRTFANRDAMARSRAAAQHRHGHANLSNKGAAIFGAKAEEESRLINDSSTVRSAQVIFVFLGALVLAGMLVGGDRAKNKKGSRQ